MVVWLVSGFGQISVEVVEVSGLALWWQHLVANYSLSRRFDHEPGPKPGVNPDVDYPG